MDRLRALEIFAAVADRGSFVKAADTLGVSTAVVSRMVQDLEALLGLQLLQRTTRRVSLTIEGEGVLQRARHLLESFGDLAATGRDGTQQMAGDIRFTAPASFAARLVPALSAFTARHPETRVQLLATDAALDLVEQRIDLALRIARELPDGLIARRLGAVRLGVFAAPAYLARRGTPKHPNELGTHECLVHRSGGRDASWPFVHPVTQERIEPTVRGPFCANNAEALMAAAVRGLGLALLPHFIVREAVARGELQPVLTQWPTPSLAIALAYTARRNQPLRVRRLIDHLAQVLRPIIDSEPDATEPQRNDAMALPHAAAVA